MTTVAVSDLRDGFLFLGNHPFLDFINTRPVVHGKAEELLTDWSSLLRWFRAAGLIDSREGARFERIWAQSHEAEDTLRAFWDFREKARKDLLAWERGATVRVATLHELNELMSKHPMLTKIRTEAGKLATTQWFPSQRPDDLFAPIASAAANLFSEVNPARVRKCEHCVLHFHDVSKIGTRRWCSMRLCGNRAKVAGYAARQGNLSR